MQGFYNIFKDEKVQRIKCDTGDLYLPYLIPYIHNYKKAILVLAITVYWRDYYWTFGETVETKVLKIQL